MRIVFALTLVTTFIISKTAQAYIGPGLGVALVGYTFGPVVAIIATVVLVAYFPLRYLYNLFAHEFSMAI